MILPFFRLSFLFIFLLPGRFQASAQTEGNTIKPFSIGEIRILDSKILQEERVLNIYLPVDYDTAKSYPKIFLLDGSANEDFLHVVGLLQFFQLQMQMPDLILVGISNRDRKKDFTFPTTDTALQSEYPTTGHSAAFIRFLENELQPFIDSVYLPNDTAMLIGQSLGGLLATEILLHKPQLFSHYFIVSPSIWWDNQTILQAAPNLLRQMPEGKTFVFIAVGGKEHPVMQKDAKALYKILKSARTKIPDLHFLRMPKESHASILHLSLFEGFTLLYPYP